MFICPSDFLSFAFMNDLNRLSMFKIEKKYFNFLSELAQLLYKSFERKEEKKRFFVYRKKGLDNGTKAF